MVVAIVVAAVMQVVLHKAVLNLKVEDHNKVLREPDHKVLRVKAVLNHKVKERDHSKVLQEQDHKVLQPKAVHNLKVLKVAIQIEILNHKMVKHLLIVFRE